MPGLVLRVPSGELASTGEVMRLAREQDVPLAVVKPGAALDEGALGLDAPARAFMQRDLDSGYAVVAPAKVPEGVSMAGWWRVHPGTG